MHSGIKLFSRDPEIGKEEFTMDKYMEICISLGAATAANCVPCFEHYYSKAEDLGITPADVEKAVEIAVKVRGGAHMVMKDAIRNILNTDKPRGGTCCNGASQCCD
jgi:hypothetical protein